MPLTRPLCCLCFWLTAALTGATGLTAQPAGASGDGQQIYQAECAECHLDDGSGGVGSDIRGVTRNRVARAIKGFDEMPEIPLTPLQLDALVAYLAGLPRS